MSGRASAQSVASQGGPHHHDPAPVPSASTSAVAFIASLRAAYNPRHPGVQRCEGDGARYSSCQTRNQLRCSSPRGLAPQELSAAAHQLPTAPSLSAVGPQPSTPTTTQGWPPSARQPSNQPPPHRPVAAWRAVTATWNDSSSPPPRPSSSSLPWLSLPPPLSSLSAPPPPPPTPPLPPSLPSQPPPSPPPIPTSALMRLNQRVITRCFLALCCPACCLYLLSTTSESVSTTSESAAAEEERLRLAWCLVLVCGLYERAALDLTMAVPAVAGAAPQAQARAWGGLHDVLVRELLKMECVGAACERLFWRDVLDGNEVGGVLVEFRVKVGELKAWWGDWSSSLLSGSEAVEADG